MKPSAGLSALLKCPDCERPGNLVASAASWSCPACGRAFTVTASGILCMLASNPKGVPAASSDPDYLKWQEVFPQAFAARGPVHRFIDDSTHRWIAAAFARHAVAPDAWVADLGCGTGDHFVYFKRSDNAIGLDIRQAPLEESRRRNKDITLIQADVERLPFKDGALDHVFVLHVLEHIARLDVTLREIARVVKADGLLYVGLPCEGGWLRDALRDLIAVRKNSRRYGIDYRKVARIEHCHSAAEVIAKAKERFTVTRCRYFPFSLARTPGINLTVSLELKKKAARP